MRLTRWSLIITFALGVTVYSQTVVRTDQNNTGIYLNETREMYEEPVARVSRGTQLTVLETTSRNYRVRTADGDEGWVERRLVSDVAPQEGSRARGSRNPSTAFVFDDAEVQGYLDNPAPVFIMDTDDGGSDPITLDRSFKDALKQNVDRETMERLMR